MAKVRTKCVYDPADESDGLRVLVTRYWPRGVRKEKAGAWLKGLGPSKVLIADWKGGRIHWAEFKARYASEFRSDPEKPALLEELRAIVAKERGAVTLLCTCRDEGQCHRSLLRAML